MSYEDFAEFYDLLTSNIDYSRLATYYNQLLKKYSETNGTALLDLACGSGSLSLPLKNSGFSVTGCDLSETMLTKAAEKSLEIQWLRLDMTELPFWEQFDFVVCALDSINHLENKKQITDTFTGVYSALRSGGVFAADMNTVYKNVNVLGNNAFTFDYEGLYCGWQNELDENDPLCRVDMFLDFFCLNKNGMYERYSDSLSEIALPVEEVERMLEECGFEVCEVSEYETGEKLKPHTEKFAFVARKI